MDKLIIFDINGTIIKRDERTDLPYSIAINKLLGAKNAMEGVDTSARSDKDVFIEVLKNFNINFTDSIWEKFLSLYRKELDTFKNTDIWRENVDVVDFIKYLSAKKYPLALISGELTIGAKYKLEKIGVWNFFLTGGFGEDALRRFDIADIALKKILDIHKEKFSDIFVIGDTVLDIQTARHLNAKSIAITTGSHSKDKLLSENPDYCIDSFSEIKNIF